MKSMIDRIESLLLKLNYAINSLHPADTRAIGQLLDELFFLIRKSPTELKEIKKVLKSLIKEGRQMEPGLIDSDLLNQFDKLIVDIKV